jgi:peptidyl-prolyl cis-trans isomerase C
MRYGRAVAIACVCVALLADLGGCGCTKKRPPKLAKLGPVIATVDGEEIPASALVREYQTVPVERRPYYAANRRELLDFIINRMVIVAEATAAGLDKDPQVLAQVSDARGFALRMLLDKEIMRTCAPITDERLHDRYLADITDAAGPTIVTQTILYCIPADETTAGAIHKTIHESRESHVPFGTLGPQQSLDFVLVPQPIPPGSDITPGLATDLNALKRFAATPLRDIGDKQFIFYREPLPFERARLLLEAALLNEQLAKGRDVWVESARSEAEVATYPERFADDAGDDDVLAAVDGTTITVADARRALDLMPPARRAQYEADANRLVEHLVRNELLVQEAERRGLDKSDDLLASVRDARDGALIRAMRERVLAQIELAITDEELRAMAAEASGGKVPSEFIELSAIANPDKAKLEKALDELKAGKPFGEVHAAYSADARQHIGTYADTTLETMPEPLRAATEGLKDGEYTDIIEMGSGYLIVRVARRPAVVNVEPWRRQLLARKRDEYFLEWVNERKASHRIVVNTKRLDEVELPKGPPTLAQPDPTPTGP